MLPSRKRNILPSEDGLISGFPSLFSLRTRGVEEKQS